MIIMYINYHALLFDSKYGLHGLRLYKNGLRLYKNGLRLYKNRLQLYKNGLRLHKNEHRLFVMEVYFINFDFVFKIWNNIVTLVFLSALGKHT